MADRVALAAKENHKEFAEKIENASMTTGIVSAAVGVGASIAAPTGFGANLDLTSAPLIVTATPIIEAAATVAGDAYFYSKWKNRQQSGEAEASSQELGLTDKQIKEIRMLEDAHAQEFYSEGDFNKKLIHLDGGGVQT